MKNARTIQNGNAERWVWCKKTGKTAFQLLLYQFKYLILFIDSLVSSMVIGDELNEV